jgi:hypothetical protein
MDPLLAQKGMAPFNSDAPPAGRRSQAWQIAFREFDRDQH